ncbi:spore germination protein [Paenibacillus sp. GCM10012307]|uniref:Spore germination protein n=1 Tax=Paenibacillus roseus TaxID=2798579 RepID=A0A934MNY7_9BACL|nr:spore germination protein [Paenibacillus roseus]MBJ6360323.1 spore germination protein [Paenibacillus roseus]
MTEHYNKNNHPVHNWDRDSLKALFARTADVDIASFQLSDQAPSEVVLVYSSGLCNVGEISQTILPELEKLEATKGLDTLHEGGFYGPLPMTSVNPSASPAQISEWIFDGCLLLLIPHTKALFRMNIGHRPERNPEESTTEITIKGPKDGFIEDLMTNVALIRKRVRSEALSCDISVLGKRTRTKVALLYFEDIINPRILSEVKKRLQQIEVDGLYSINQLEEMLVDQKLTLFPLLDFTGRPDKTVSSLLAGRFVIILDGNPMVLIGPGNLSLLLKSPEDLYFSYQYISFARLIRLLSLFISMLLPGAWVALSSFHPDQLPFRLMATVASGRIGLPFSGQVELFILLVLLEIFREAGLRLPSSIGQTLTVVGGLIIGDAAIRAGLVSPSVVVVGAVTAVTSVTLVNQSLSGSVSVIRIGLFFISAFMGMYGLLLGIVLVLGYMSRLRSFGVPYLAPLSPFNSADILKSVLRFPWVWMKRRPATLRVTDPDSKGETEG